MNLENTKKELTKEIKNYKKEIEKTDKIISLKTSIKNIKDIKTLLNDDIKLKKDNNYFDCVDDILTFIDELAEKYDKIFGDNKLYNAFENKIKLISEDEVFYNIVENSDNLEELRNNFEKIEGQDTHYIRNGYGYENVETEDVFKHFKDSINEVIDNQHQEYKDELKELMKEGK